MRVHTVDSLETYAPSHAAPSVNRLLDIAAENDWELRPQKMKQTFIQADLDFNVFMKLPDSCGDKRGKNVRLNKSSLGNGPR